MKPIYSDGSDPISKITDKIPRDNQQEGGISNQVDNPHDERYCDIFKIDYLGIKIMLDKGKLNYSCFFIVHTCKLKIRLEELKIKRYEVTIASVDAINMYLMIILSKIIKLVRFFARELTASTKKTHIIFPCLSTG